MKTSATLVNLNPRSARAVNAVIEALILRQPKRASGPRKHKAPVESRVERQLRARLDGAAREATRLRAELREMEAQWRTFQWACVVLENVLIKALDPVERARVVREYLAKLAQQGVRHGRWPSGVKVCLQGAPLRVAA